MDELRDDKRFLGMGEVVRLALPTAAGMINWTVMNFIDGFMVSRLIGPRAFSAQFVAGILAFVPASLAMGVLGMANTFISQNLGANRRRRCGRYAWSALYLAAAMAVAMLPLAAAAPAIFRGFGWVNQRLGGVATHPQEMGMQATYFRYIIAGTGVGLMSRAMEQFFYGTHRPIVVYLASLLSATVNAVMDYVLITGAWGLPAMGIRGAAVATVIGWGMCFLVLMGLFCRRSEQERFFTRSTWRPRRRPMLDILRVGWPAGVLFCGDMSAWTVFNAFLVGHFGEVHKAASNAAIKYMNIAFLPVIGISIATTALVGRHIGAGRGDLARRRAHAAVLLAVAYMAVCSLVFFVFRYPLIEVFAKVPAAAGTSEAEQLATRAEIIRIGTTVLICAAVFQCFDAVGIVFRGALRGAGDTFWPMLVMLSLAATVLVGGGFAFIAWAPRLTSIGPWLAASGYVIALGFVMALRFESGRWRRIDLLGRRGRSRAAPAGPMPEAAAAPPADLPAEENNLH